MTALKEDATLSGIAARFEIHPNMVNLWKRQTVEGMSSFFTGKANRHDVSQETRIKELHEKIGHLMVEREIGTRLRSISRDQRKSVVEMNHPRLAVVRQCHLLGLCRRSTFYCKASGETPKNLALIGLTPDEVYCDRPGPPVVPDRTTEAA